MAATPRQILYGLVAAGFHLVVAVLIAAGSLTGAVGTGPTVVLGVLWAGAALLIGVGWRKTGRALALSMGMFVVWAATTLIGR